MNDLYDEGFEYKCGDPYCETCRGFSPVDIDPDDVLVNRDHMTRIPIQADGFYPSKATTIKPPTRIEKRKVRKRVV